MRLICSYVASFHRDKYYPLYYFSINRVEIIVHTPQNNMFYEAITYKGKLCSIDTNGSYIYTSSRYTYKYTYRYFHLNCNMTKAIIYKHIPLTIAIKRDSYPKEFRLCFYKFTTKVRAYALNYLKTCLSDKRLKAFRKSEYYGKLLSWSKKTRVSTSDIQMICDHYIDAFCSTFC